MEDLFPDIDQSTNQTKPPQSDAKPSPDPKPKKPPKKEKSQISNPKSQIQSAPNILVVHTDGAVNRLIRESLTNFTGARVYTAPNPLHAFELALIRHYDLFVFATELDPMGGELLYEFIAKAYYHDENHPITAPAIVYITEPGRRNEPQQFLRDARVKGTLSWPFSIDNLLKLVAPVLPVFCPYPGPPKK